MGREMPIVCLLVEKRHLHFPLSRWIASEWKTDKKLVNIGDSPKSNSSTADIFMRMTNTYTQINIHYVFAVKYRAAAIESSWETRLHKYITGIFENNGTKLIQINGMADHIHILTGMNVNNSISSIVGKVKAESSRWINNEALTKSKFAWQEGYGAFSHSASQLPDVIRYIQNQKIHHQNHLFKDEYKALLKAFEIAYQETFVFHEPV